MPVLNGVAYEEINSREAPSPSYVTGIGQTEGIRHFNIAWDDIEAFERGMMGEEVWTGGLLVDYRDPQVFPLKPDWPARTFRVQGVKSLGIGANGAQEFEIARVTVTYGPQETSRSSGSRGGASSLKDILSTQQIEIGGEVFTWGPGVWKFQTSENAIDSGLGKVMKYMQSRVTLYNVSQLRLDRYVALEGKINNAAWPKDAPARQKAAAETVLFDGLFIEHAVTAEGVEPYDITLVFRWREQSWNKAYDPSTNAWDYVIPTGGGDGRLFEAADLEPLLERE